VYIVPTKPCVRGLDSKVVGPILCHYSDAPVDVGASGTHFPTDH
jgi:hypothetical protein